MSCFSLAGACRSAPLFSPSPVFESEVEAWDCASGPGWRVPQAQRCLGAAGGRLVRDGSSCLATRVAPATSPASARAAVRRSLGLIPAGPRWVC